MSETERILIKEVLNEIYVAGDELQTYENLLNKIVEMKETTEIHVNPKFVDMQRKILNDIKGRIIGCEPLSCTQIRNEIGDGYIHTFKLKEEHCPAYTLKNTDKNYPDAGIL